MNEFNLQQLVDKNLLLRTELIQLTCAMGMIVTCQTALTMGTASAACREIALLLDLANESAKGRVKEVSDLLFKINNDAALAIELLKEPVSTATQ
jgi:hypothetical protein